MAKLEAVCLIEGTPQAIVPQVGDTYQFIRDIFLTTGVSTSEVADGAAAVAFTYQSPAYVTGGAKIVSWKNDVTEKASLDKDGNFELAGTVDGRDIAADGVILDAVGFKSDGDTQITPTTPIVLDASSGREIGLDWSMEVVQTGTAGYDADFVDVTETSTGSGAKYLHRRAVGGIDKYFFNNNGQLHLDPAQAYGNTTGLMFGNGDTGFYETADNSVVIRANASDRGGFTVSSFFYGSAGLDASPPSSTVPNLLPSFGDINTGIGYAGSDSLSIIAGGVEGIRLSEASSHILLSNENHAGLTASTTQTQVGALQLLSSYNEVSVVANDNDSAKLPDCQEGVVCEIINHGANILRLYPFSGDNLGSGIDVFEILEPNQSILYRCIDAVNWHVVSTDRPTHGSMFDEDNTDAFVINDAGGDFHSYHTNGMVAGDAFGWTFDMGGAGVSHAISAITDGIASGTDINVETGDAHGLSVGDVISQTNLANAAYVGIFLVKAVIDTTNYEVEAVFTATGTGTMDQAATLTANTGADGEYSPAWDASATSSTNNETFDYAMYKNATVISGTKARRKFGTGGDFGAWAKQGPDIPIVAGDKISLAFSNSDSAGNTTFRHFLLKMKRA